ncbi:hypothetical protein ACWCQW_45075 [Streptomyces mirabilis]
MEYRNPPASSTRLPIQMWHTPDCPQWTIMQINFEAGSQRIKEQDTWAKGVFPAAHERLKQAAATMPPGTAAQPFIEALTELVQTQADFPPHLPDPDHTTD